MQTPLRLLLSALVAGAFGVSSANAQQTVGNGIIVIEVVDGQDKEVEAKIQELLKQLQALQAKKAADTKKPADVKKPAPPNVEWKVLPGAPSDNPVAVLEALLKSSDPKVAAMAKELLAALKHKQPAPPTGGVPFKFEVVPGVGKPKSAPPVEFELKIEGQPHKMLGTATAPAPGASTLKLSADGKTAAVVAADGSITIYDVATGKEQMKFPAKK